MVEFNHILLTILLPVLFTSKIGGAEKSIAQFELPITISKQFPENLMGKSNQHEIRKKETFVQQSEILQPNIDQSQCTLYKVVFDQRIYFEYIHYKINIPDLKEFTLCMWTKFTNHSNDHPLFSYAVDGQSRSILSWIANTQRRSYYMLNIDGHNLYRLNYPLKLNKWYHSCQSWNGHTGEWQIWVNDERVGRGFNNRLVGHVIKGGGTAISGLEQQQQDSIGMFGEMTMVQLYGVALTAGKAHRDHKHHHAHHFDHEMNNNAPISTPQFSISRDPLSKSPFLTGGQLNHQVKINPGSHIQIIQNGVTLRHPSLPAPSEAPQPLPPVVLTVPRTVESPFVSSQTTLNNKFENKLVNVDNTVNKLQLSPKSYALPINGYSFTNRHYRNIMNNKIFPFKQDNIQLENEKDTEDIIKPIENIEFKKITKRENGNKNMKKKKFGFIEIQDKTRKTNDIDAMMASSNKQKRDIIDTNDSVIDNSHFQQMFDLLTESRSAAYSHFGGLTNFSITPTTYFNQRNNEREIAEYEVRQVMNICDGCTEEPFAKALIMSWRDVPKILYSGALHVPALQICKMF